MAQRAPASRARWQVAAAGLALLAAAAVAAWWGLRPPAPAPIGAPSTLVPATAPLQLWTAPLGELADALHALAGKLEGSGGLVEAAGMALGLSRLDRPALAAAGLSADAGVAAFAWDGALFIALPAVSEPGVRYVLQTLERRGLRLLAAGPRRYRDEASGLELRWLADDALLLRAPLPAAAATLLGETGVVGDAGAATDVGAAGGAQPTVAGAGAKATAPDPKAPGAADAAFARWQAAARRPASATAGLHLEVRLGAGDGLRPALRRGAGAAALLFGRAIDAIEGAVVDVDGLAAAPRLQLRLQLPEALSRELAAYHQGFLAAGAGLDLGALLPDEVALVARGRLNPALLGMIPDILRQRLLPKELLGRLDPALAAVDTQMLLIDAWDGQLALGLLGIDDAIALGPQALADPMALLRAAGVFAAIGLRDAAAGEALRSALEAALAAAGRPGEPVQLGAFGGRHWPDARPPTALLGAGRALVLLSGDDELARWRRVADGKLPSAGVAAAGALERDLWRGEGHWWAAGSTLGRVVRAARRRGIPEHFVRMIASLAALTARVSLDERGLLAEVLLRPAPAGAAEPAP